jgi:hypothetical protein
MEQLEHRVPLVLKAHRALLEHKALLELREQKDHKVSLEKQAHRAV